MPAASNGVAKINETVHRSALSSWDERFSRSTKSNYNFLTVSKEPLGKLVLASKLGEDARVGPLPFSLLVVPAVAACAGLGGPALIQSHSVYPGISSVIDVEPSKGPGPVLRAQGKEWG